MKSRNVQAPYPAPATARYNFKTDHIGADLRSSMQAKPRARRRPDPLAGIWDSEVVPILKAAPDIRPYVVFGEISRRHPEIGLGICRTLERRIRRWQELNDPGPDATFLLRPSPDQWFLTPRLVANFLKSAHQGTLKLPDLPAQTRTHPSISGIIKYCKSGTLQKRSKALLALAVICNIPLRYLASYPISSKPSLYRWRKLFLTSGFDKFIPTPTRKKLRFKNDDVTKAIFKILHEPPELHGFARTNWRQVDLKSALERNGTIVSIWTIRRAIRASKYQWRRAKIVLTSNDPDYRLKVQHIKQILSELARDECFFSIDEYGPFTVRFVPGKKLCAPDEAHRFRNGRKVAERL